MKLKEYKDAIEKETIRTLRDDFAREALGGLLAANPIGPAEYTEGRSRQYAKSAYLLADAMLLARKDKP